MATVTVGNPGCANDTDGDLWAASVGVSNDGGSAWYVDDDAPNDPGPGDPAVGDPLENGTADHPFDAIQEGIDAALGGDQVLVLDGIYTGIGNRNIDFQGKAITVRSQSGDPEVCVVDCENAGRGFNFCNNEGPSAVLRDLTVKRGSASNAGAIRCIQEAPSQLHPG